jgi:hypothetical protein
MRLATYMKDDESASCVSNCGLVKLRINECVSSGDQKKIQISTDTQTNLIESS